MNKLKGVNQRMVKTVRSKLRDTSGESIAETLIALLVSALALMMLAGAVDASTHVITRSKDKMTDYYAAEASMINTTPSPSATINMVITDQTGSTVQTYDNLGYYTNSEFGGKTVAMYLIPISTTTP